MSRRQTHVWAIYVAALIGIIVVSHLSAFGAFAVYDTLPRDVQRAWWTGYALNYAAPFAGGTLFALALIAGLTKLQRFTPTLRDHALRAFSWYAFAAWVLMVMYSNRDNTDLGLWVQVILWPMVGTLGALAVDVLITLRRRSRKEAAA